MRTWITANGGPLALVVVGLALTGYTTSYGWILVAGGSIWWLLHRFRHKLPIEIRRRWRVQADLEASASHDGHHLVVAIKNDAETLRDAGMHVLIPKRFQIIVRVGFDDRRTDRRHGVHTDTTERLPGESEGALHWHDKGIHFLGGGHTTRSHFIIRNPPQGGTFPVRVKVYDDAVRLRSINEDLTFTVQPHSVDPERRKAAATRLREELTTNRWCLSHSLSYGHYWPGLHTETGVAKLRAADLDPTMRAPEFREAVETAYAECARIARIATPGEPPYLRPVEEGHHAERALVEVLIALRQLDRVSSEAELV